MPLQDSMVDKPTQRTVMLQDREASVGLLVILMWLGTAVRSVTPGAKPGASLVIVYSRWRENGAISAR
jgi:hypothetical protein